MWTRLRQWLSLGDTERSVQRDVMDEFGIDLENGIIAMRDGGGEGYETSYTFIFSLMNLDTDIRVEYTIGVYRHEIGGDR